MKKVFIYCLVISVNICLAFSQPGSVDPSFNPGTSANDVIHFVKVQPDGKILLGGRFTTFNGITANRIIRLLNDGTIDPTFNTGTGANANIYGIDLQSDGKILIAGPHTMYNGNVSNRITRINADGSFDSSFNPSGVGSNDEIDFIKVLPDDKIVLGGLFTAYNGITANRIARLNSDGTLDNTFNTGTGANNIVYSISLQTDGKIIIGGNFNTFNSEPRYRVARLNINGSLDTEFTNSAGGANSYVYRTTIQPDGKIIIGGWFTSYNGVNRKCIARLNIDGSLDTSFNPGSGASGNFIDPTLILSNGKLLVGGRFSSYNGVSCNNLVLLNANGSVDTGFQSGVAATGDVASLVNYGNDKILIGGNFSSYNGVNRIRIARIVGCLPTSSNINIQACKQYTAPDNQTYTTSGTKTATIINQQGCDSVITINLTINPLPEISMTALGNYTSLDAPPFTLIASPEGGTFTGPGVSGSQFNPLAAGLGSRTIHYSYTNGSGCSAITSQSTIVYDTIGVVCTSYDTIRMAVTDTLRIYTLVSNSPNAAMPISIKLYPNPTRNQITIDYNNYYELTGYSLQITNSLGQEVYNATISQPTVTLNLSGWTGNGIYNVRLKNAGGQTISTKIIVIN